MVRDDDTGLTRFTQNAIHQNVVARDTVVRVRVVTDARTGVAATNDTSDASLQAVVERARAMAALAPRDEAWPGLAAVGRGAAAPPGAFDGAAAHATPERRASLVAEIFEAAHERELWAAGYVTTGRSGITIANSAGTVASFDGTTCAINVKANGADSTGYAERYGNALAVLDAGAVAHTAAEKAVRGADPIAVEPGAWTVILEPPAFGELFSYLTDHFSAQAYDEGSSFASSGLGRTYAGTNVNVADDHAHPLHAGMPFDFEGYPTARTPLFAGGTAAGVVTDATWSRRLGRPNTGNGQPAPSAAGPEPMHVVVAPGTRDVRDLIAETERGLLVTRFWYIRPVDRRKAIVTGMTRDGTYLIEKGEIVRGVRNLRFNQSILDALRRAEFAAGPARTGGYGYSLVTPAVKIDGFTFTSTTAF